MNYKLNINSKFYSIKDDLILKHFKFNGGEINVTVTNIYEKVNGITDCDSVSIYCEISSSYHVMLLLLTADALRNMGFKILYLHMPYLPYARQDRVCNPGESFSLKVFCNLINTCDFNKVFILDAHSDVGPALLNNCINISNSDYVRAAARKICITSKSLILVSPDAGANKKVNKLASELGYFSKVVKCDKIRDLRTGNLTGFEVFSDDLNGEDCLIVDDICDGGGTFIGIAEELKKKNAGKIYLFVTHGIFSKGIEIFNGVFDGIFSTKSFNPIEGVNYEL